MIVVSPVPGGSEASPTPRPVSSPGVGEGLDEGVVNEPRRNMVVFVPDFGQAVAHGALDVQAEFGNLDPRSIKTADCQSLERIRVR